MSATKKDGSPRKAPASFLRDPKEKKLRAFHILNKMLGEGKNKQQIAQEMNVNVQTVERTMKWASQANVFVEYEQRIFDDLVPLAHEAIRMALEDGDAQVALKIYEGVRLLKKDSPKGKAVEENDEGLYGEIARIRAGHVINVTPEPRAIGPGNEWDAIIEADGEEIVVSSGVPTGGIHGIQETEANQGSIGGEDSSSATPTAVEEQLVFRFENEGN